MKKVTIPIPDNIAKIFANGADTFLVAIGEVVWEEVESPDGWSNRPVLPKPPCNEGDELWLKETWLYVKALKRYLYKSDGDYIWISGTRHNIKVFIKDESKYYPYSNMSWKSPVTMPSEAVRWKFQCQSIETIKLINEPRTNEFLMEDHPEINYEKWWNSTYPKHPFDKAWAWVITIERGIC